MYKGVKKKNNPKDTPDGSHFSLHHCGICITCTNDMSCILLGEHELAEFITFFREVSAPTIPNSCAIIESAMNNRDKTPQYIESKQIPVPVDINFYYKKIWINIQKVAGIVNSKAT